MSLSRLRRQGLAVDIPTIGLKVAGGGEVGNVGENGTVGEAGGEEKKTSLGDMRLGVRRCFPIIDTPMAGLRGVRIVSLSSVGVRMVRLGSRLELGWPPEYVDWDEVDLDEAKLMVEGEGEGEREEPDRPAELLGEREEEEEEEVGSVRSLGERNLVLGGTSGLGAAVEVCNRLASETVGDTSQQPV